MKYEEFEKTLNDKIFGKSKADLIEKLARYPERYIGLFRPTKPHAKIIQNLTQSNEIRFGDAFEILIEKYLVENGYKVLNKRFKDEKGNDLVLDQLVKKSKVIFIEQKIRDDHDSTKKRGQIQNFEKKLSILLKEYKEKDLQGYFCFIDPSLLKNRNYYIKEIKKMNKDYGVELYLVYGKDLFAKLKLEKVWLEIENHLRKWKEELSDLPDINFDKNAEETFNEIKDIGTNIFRKLFDNEEIIKEIFPILFPGNKTIKLLKKHFSKQENKIYKTFIEKINRIDKINNKNLLEIWGDDIDSYGYVVVKYGQWRGIEKRFKSWGGEKQKVRIVAQANAGEALHTAEADLLGYIFFDDSIKVDINKDYALQVDGDSMNNRQVNGKYIEDGDYVLVKSDLNIENGDVVVSIVKDGVNIKELNKHKKGITLKSISKNKKHKNIDIDLNEYTNLGKVVDVIKE